MEQIEFVIHPDGRVEEKVTGIKGKNVRSPPSLPHPPPLRGAPESPPDRALGLAPAGCRVGEPL